MHVARAETRDRSLRQIYLRIAPDKLVATANMRLTIKAINDELRRLRQDVLLDKGDGYFYFWKGDANKWLDRTVKVPNVSSLTLEQWIGESTG
jgi:hypothetical protein